MAHEMYHTIVLVCYQTTHLLDRGRTYTFKADSRSHIVDDLFQAYPLGIDVSGGNPFSRGLEGMATMRKPPSIFGGSIR